MGWSELVAHAGCLDGLLWMMSEHLLHIANYKGSNFRGDCGPYVKSGYKVSL